MPKLRILHALICFYFCTLSAHAQATDSIQISKPLQTTESVSYTVNNQIVKAFAPTGVLRASLNVGNPVLANLDSQDKPFGISIDSQQLYYLISA